MAGIEPHARPRPTMAPLARHGPNVSPHCQMSAPALLALSGKSPELPRHPQQLRGITHCDTGPYPVPATSGHWEAVLAASWQMNDYTNGKCWAL